MDRSSANYTDLKITFNLNAGLMCSRHRGGAESNIKVWESQKSNLFSGNCITTPVVCDATSVKQKRKSVESISASSLNLN